MKVILLAATQDEARQHARDAGLKPHSRDVIAPGGAVLLEGLRVTEDDLVMEFPGFRERRDAEAIIETLKGCIRKTGDAGPVWRTAGANRSKDRLPA